jgi:hypothetical protein
MNAATVVATAKLVDPKIRTSFRIQIISKMSELIPERKKRSVTTKAGKRAARARGAGAPGGGIASLT